jgi:hypothetical protein
VEFGVCSMRDLDLELFGLLRTLSSKMFAEDTVTSVSVTSVHCVAFFCFWPSLGSHILCLSLR